ncbi:MAG: HEAT repeat domain-containing protein, partial [Myxococcota bacterium]|nr:HEAT repeat domain-containing protein [Myxococcota bacterium]
MTMTTCPTCQKPVDSLRARNVGVRDGKVVAYCSSECAAAAESRPIRLPPRTPAVGTPQHADDLDSGPVIEIVHEPASGVVTSARDERTDSRPVRGDSSGVNSGGMDSAVASGELGGSKGAKGRARSQPSGRHLTRERKDSTESKAGWDWLDEEPADQGRSRTASVAEREGGRSGRTFVPLLLGFLLLGAAAFGVYYLVLRDAPAKERELVKPVGSGSAAAATDAATAVDAGPPPITRETALASAITLLRKYLAESLPRVQRLAAGALGRTGDPEAITALVHAVTQEKVPAARFLLAYQLARAGDKRGIDALVAGLGSPARGDKLDAA